MTATRGILDTSVLIDLRKLDATLLPEEPAITAVTLAELSDLMIAATASILGLPLYTRNPRDFAGLESMLVVIGV